MDPNGIITAKAELSATIIRADGSHREVQLSKPESLDVRMLSKKLQTPLKFWGRLHAELRRSRLIPATVGLGAFIHWMMTGDDAGMGLALVTTVGMNYLAADFLASSVNHISAFNFHDTGTGTTAPAISDTALVAQAGPTTRATGTQSNPVAGTYKSVGTISYSSTLNIAELGLFSQAAQGGTLWDRRTFTAMPVDNTISVSYAYSVSMTAGGS